jgi:type 1 fimbria pilin
MTATGRRTFARTAAAAMLLPALVLLLLAAPAWAANVVNVTIHIPTTVYDNPCVGEPVALHGDIHVVVSTTTDTSGSFHFVSKWNASYSGTGLLSGGAYTASESKQESWTASQLPASHTTTSVIKLISKGGAQNAFLYTTMTTTIDANGVPTVTVDSTLINCRG